MHVMVIRFNALGDIVLTLPALAYLRHRVPDLHLSFVSHARWRGLLELSPLIDRLIVLEPEESFPHFRKRLSMIPADYLLDMHGSLRSRLLFIMSGRKVWRTESTHYARDRLVRKRPHTGHPHPHKTPVWLRHLLSISRYIGLSDEIEHEFIHQMRHDSRRKCSAEKHGPGQDSISHVCSDPLLRAPEDARARVRERLRTWGLEGWCADIPVILLPGAHWHTKRWPGRHFRSVLEWLSRRKIPVVLAGSPEERLLLESLASAHPAAEVTCQSWSEIVAWLEHCRVAIGNDSGLTHLAEAMRVPVIAVFGATTPAFGFAPRLESSRVVSLQLPCQPCSLHGSQACPLGMLDCLERLEPERVLAELAALLQLNGFVNL